MPPQDTTRQGPQSVHVNFDATTAAFLNTSLTLLQPFTPQVNPFDLGVGPAAGGAAHLAAPLQLGGPAPGATGTRIGMQALGLQVDWAAGGALTISELANARTIVLQ